MTLTYYFDLQSRASYGHDKVARWCRQGLQLTSPNWFKIVKLWQYLTPGILAYLHPNELSWFLSKLIYDRVVVLFSMVNICVFSDLFGYNITEVLLGDADCRVSMSFGVISRARLRFYPCSLVAAASTPFHFRYESY